MATKTQFSADFAPKLPGKTRPGSQAHFRKGATRSARASMAEIIARYAQLLRSLEEATPTIVYNAMLPVLNQSQIYVPKDTGALMASAQLTVGTDEKGRPMAVLTYGDADTPYAALVHEMVHLNHEPPTRAKYLQAAMEEELDAFLVSVATDYAMVLNG